MNRPIIITWYVVADGGRARIVKKRARQGDRPEAFDTLQECVSVDLHRATHDLGTERPGRTRESATSGRHAVQPRQDLHRAEKQNFAHEVAALLSEASQRGEFDALVLVAPAHVLSDLRQAFDAPTQRKITAELQKDLTKVPNADLAKHLADLSGD
jgi:protein required for attachment to host cells